MKFILEYQETERLLFRKVNSADFDQWMTFFTDPTSFQHWPGDFDPPEIECAKWYEKQFGRYEKDLGGMNALVEKSSGKLVGHCGLLIQQVDQKMEMEIAYSLLSPFRGRGYAFEAARKCKHYAFDNAFAESLISIISLTNTPSMAVAFRNGMHIEKETRYHGHRVNIFRVFSHAPDGREA